MTEKSRKVNESQIDFLMPCPCCGSTKIHVVAPDDGCYCWDCGLMMPNRPNWRERWNRRVPSFWGNAATPGKTWVTGPDTGKGVDMKKVNEEFWKELEELEKEDE